MNTLKRCPFCGGSNIKLYAGSIGPDCEVGCEDCNVWIGKEVPWNGMTREEHDAACRLVLTDAWNTRTDEKEAKA